MLSPLLLAAVICDSPAEPEAEFYPLCRCGPIALKLCLDALELPATLAEIQAGGDPDEMKSLQQLEATARRLGGATVAVRWRAAPLPTSRGVAPAILPIVLPNGRQHFVALLESRNGRLLIWDFPRPPDWVDQSVLRLDLAWTGAALHVCRDIETAQWVKRTANGDVRRHWVASAILLSIAAVLAFLSSMQPRKRTPRPDSNRSGFTLVELLVVLAIVGVLVSLTLPAVQRARESARQVECRNRLHQLMIATQSFEASEGRYPLSRLLITAARGRRQSTFMSPHVELLGFLDQAALQKQIDWTDDARPETDPAVTVKNAAVLTASVPVFVCPTDRVPLGGNSYRACTGTSPALWETAGSAPQLESLIGWSHGNSTNSRNVVDGLSNTAFFAEKLIGDRDATRFTPWRDRALSVPADFLRPGDVQSACARLANSNPQHASYGGSTWFFAGYSHTWYNHVLLPNDLVPDCTNSPSLSEVDPGAHSARSLHAGGVHVALGDGAVRFISQHIELAVWRGMGSINGKEVAGE